MKKNKKLPSVVILLILTAITTIFWISFSVYRVFTKPNPIDISSEVTTSINPSLDLDTLNEIEKREQSQ
jgi:hypothetical protein